MKKHSAPSLAIRTKYLISNQGLEKYASFISFSVFHDFRKLSLSVITGFNCIEYERHIASCLSVLGVPVHYPR